MSHNINQSAEEVFIQKKKIVLCSEYDTACVKYIMAKWVNQIKTKHFSDIFL